MRIGQSSLVAFLTELLSSLIGFVATVYIARKLGDSGLGIYFLVIAVVIWLKILGGIGVQNALRKRLSEPGEDAPYMGASVFLQLLFVVIIVAVLFVWRDAVSAYLRGTSVFVVFALFLAALAFAFVATALEGEDKVHISTSLSPVDRSIRSGIQILALFLGFGLAGLFFGYAAGAIVAAVIGMYYVTSEFETPTREHLGSIATYAQYSWLTNLSNRAFAAMDTLVLGIFVAEGLIGVYEASWNLASILALFSVSIRRAVFPTMSYTSTEGNRTEAADLLTDALTFSGMLLIPGLVGAVLVGDLVLGIYGQGFLKGHVVLIILLAARTVYAYEDQLVNAMNAIDRPDVAFRIDFLFIVTNISLNLVLVWQFGWIGAAVGTFASAFIALAVGYVSVNALLPLSIPVREIGNQLLAALGMGVVVGFGRYLLADTVSIGILLVAVGGMIYFLLLFALSEQLRSVTRDNLPWDIPLL
jgi:O-antigen/teichoic acid export membrane protein